MDAIVQFGTMIAEIVRVVTISDLIDIAVVSYVVYKIMNMIRQSSAAQVAKALVLIVAALWLSYQLHLNTINFILGKTVELGLLALVIVFQPEIRRFLEQVGSSNKFGLFLAREGPTGEIENAIAETVAAYASMSRDKIGALTVFERHHMLDGVLESGTVLDAAVSSELMKNIFYPKAPLHDGAVIIRNGRLAGAACMLPLSGNMSLSKDLGMRHRAGIGMSEKSDAVVAIVSEETGAISVAVGGRLRRHLAPETLERFLKNELTPQQDEKPKSFRERVYMFFRKRSTGNE